MAAAVAVPLIAAAMGAGASVYGSVEQSRQAKLARNAQAGALKDQKNALAKREQDEVSMTKRNDDLAKKRARAAMSGGRQGTILTSPLGELEGKPSGTLLGG